MVVVLVLDIKYASIVDVTTLPEEEVNAIAYEEEALSRVGLEPASVEGCKAAQQPGECDSSLRGLRLAGSDPARLTTRKSPRKSG